MQIKDSHVVRDDKRRPIPSVGVRQETIGLFVADDPLGFWIESQGPAQTVRGFGQMDELSGDVSLFDRRVQLVRVAAAHAADEVGKMIAA
jgi:hypothetical protein